MSARQFYSSIEQQIQQPFALYLVHFLSFTHPEDISLSESLVSLLSQLKLFTPNGYLQFQSQKNLDMVHRFNDSMKSHYCTLHPPEYDHNSPDHFNSPSISHIMQLSTPPPHLAQFPLLPDAASFSPFLRSYLQNLPPNIEISTANTLASVSSPFKLIFFALVSFLTQSPHISQIQHSVHKYLISHFIDPKSPYDNPDSSDDNAHKIDPFGEDNQTDPYGTLIFNNPTDHPFAKYTALPLDRIFEHVGLNQQHSLEIRNSLLPTPAQHIDDFSCFYPSISSLLPTSTNNNNIIKGPQSLKLISDENYLLKNRIQVFLDLNGFDILPVLPSLCTHQALLPILLHKLLHFIVQYQSVFDSYEVYINQSIQDPITHSTDKSDNTILQHFHSMLLASSNNVESNQSDELEPRYFFELFFSQYQSALQKSLNLDSEPIQFPQEAPDLASHISFLRNADLVLGTPLFSNFHDYFYQTDVSSQLYQTAFPIACQSLLRNLPQLHLPQANRVKIGHNDDSSITASDSTSFFSSDISPHAIDLIRQTLQKLDSNETSHSLNHPLHSNLSFLLSNLAFQSIKQFITTNPKEALLSLHVSISEAKDTFSDVLHHFLQTFAPPPLLSPSDISPTPTPQLTDEAITFIYQKEALLDFYLNSLYAHITFQEFSALSTLVGDDTLEKPSPSACNEFSSSHLAPLINPSPREYFILQSQAMNPNFQINWTNTVTSSKYPATQTSENTQSAKLSAEIYTSRVNVFENVTYNTSHPLTSLYSIYTQYLTTVLSIFLAMSLLQQKTCHFQNHIQKFSHPHQTSPSTPISTETKCSCRQCKPYFGQLESFQITLQSFFIQSIHFLHCIEVVENALNQKWLEYIPNPHNLPTNDLNMTLTCGLYQRHPHLQSFLNLHPNILTSIPTLLFPLASSINPNISTTNSRNFIELFIFLLFYHYSVQFK